MKGAFNPNTDFQRELQAMLGTKGTVATEHFQDSGRIVDNNQQVETLKAPHTPQEKEAALGNQITTEQLFGDEFVEGELPELKQDFVLLKSRQDKLVELGQVAQEVYHNQRVSRGQVLAMESIARELIPASADEVTSNSRRVIVADQEVNMYTEEPSLVELKPTIDSAQTAIDSAIGFVKNSAIALGEKIISVANADCDARSNAIIQGVGGFNSVIIQFLENTQNIDLVDSKLKFKAGLNWGNLMAMGINVAHNHALGYDRESNVFETSIASFDGTSAETLFKSFGTFVAENPIAMPVIANFISGATNIISNNDDSRKSIKAALGPDCYVDGQTFGELFATFGSPRFAEFFNFINQRIKDEISAVKIILQDLPQATDLNGVVKASIHMQTAHANIMTCTANLAVICTVMQLVCDFLSNYK